MGSAFGSGGVAARCRHHRQVSQNPRWHIDYLRRRLPLREIWFTHDPQHREHQWADLLAANLALKAPFEGFGASDCHCRTHLFHAVVKPDCVRFKAELHREWADHGPVYCEIV